VALVGKQAFEQKMAAIEELRAAPDESARTQLRTALKDRNNFLTAKAAAIAAARRFQELIPDLVTSFERFLRDPVKSDPQCWAKNAIAKALIDLGHDDAAVFLKGVSHIQLEPVWGGVEDTATTLRSSCAMGLIASRLDSFSILVHLTDLLNDLKTPVRVNAARAMAQLSAREAILPLRLKSLAGDKEPEVIGATLAALLGLDGARQLDFVAKFLEHKDPEIRLEAVAALAVSREPGAFTRLKAFWDVPTDTALKKTVIDLIAAAPDREAAEFLLSVVEDGPSQIAAHALGRLLAHRHAAEMKQEIAAVVERRGDPELERAFRQDG
jgi:HEAT repeat protein